MVSKNIVGNLVVDVDITLEDITVADIAFAHIAFVDFASVGFALVEDVALEGIAFVGSAYVDIVFEDIAFEGLGLEDIAFEHGICDDFVFVVIAHMDIAANTFKGGDREEVLRSAAPEARVCDLPMALDGVRLGTKPPFK